MTKLEAMALSEGLTRLVVGMESDLMKNIADFLAAGQAETSTALWKIKKLAELGALNKKNKQTISEYAEIQPEMQQITLEAAAIKAIEQVEPGFRQLVKEGILNDAEAMPMSDTMARVIKALGKQAKSDLNLVNTTMLYKAKKAAEKVINDTVELANKQEFLDSLNKAAGKVVTGIESRQAAMRQCIGEMTEKGIPAFTDKLGREWSPEAYTNMCIRTTVAKTATETQMERMNDYGVNLVAVSSHIGARPLCAPYQGRIFDRNNGSGYITDLNDNKIRYEPWSSTSYGKPAGLLGINCGHQIYPFIPGINVQRYFPYDEAENAEQYKKVQKQRQLEREVRAAKRECTALDTVGDKEGLKQASARLKQRERNLKEFCNENNLKYKVDRTATPGYNKSVSSKTNSAYKQFIYDKYSSYISSSVNDTYKIVSKITEDGDKWLLDGFVKAVNKGDVNVLVGIDQYINTAREVEKELVGMTTSNGIEIRGYTAHFIDRIIGQVADPKKGYRTGVTVQQAKDALASSNVENIKTRKDGKRSQVFHGFDCKVSVNPDTKMLIQTNPAKGGI